MIQNDSMIREILTDCSTQQLDNLLEKAIMNEPPDESTIRMILQELQDRENDHPADIDDGIAEAWAKYRKNQELDHREIPITHKTGWSWALKVAAVFLVFCMLIPAITHDAQANTFLGKIAQWSESIFEFLAPEDIHGADVEYVFKTDHPGLQQVYDTVVELGVSDPIVPTWLPDEFELEEIKEIPLSRGSKVTALFLNSNNSVVFEIKIYSEHTISEYHKDDQIAVEYEKAGVTHYLISNNEIRTAAWINDSAECTIASNCREDELLMILESIYILEGQ